MSALTAAIVVGGLGAAYIGSQGAKSAAKTQAQAAQQTSDSAQNIYNQQAEVNKPYVAAGLSGQGQLMNYLGLSGNTGAQDYGKYATAEFTPAQFAAGQDPGYAFRMSEGLKALDKTAAARGGALSGAALKGATAYGQGMASDEYQNAFNRYQTTRANTLNPYQQLQGVGQAAAAGQAANLGSLGAAQQQAITGAANATSAGTMAGANIAAGGINAMVNTLGRQSAYQNPYATTAYNDWTIG
jgi:hypothetical protein